MVRNASALLTTLTLVKRLSGWVVIPVLLSTWSRSCRTFWLNTLRPRQNGRHFADDIFKCIFLNENVWIPIKIHWRLFVRVQLTIFQHWFRWWLGAVQATSHYRNQGWLVYWRIYASLGLNELNVLVIKSTLWSEHCACWWLSTVRH